MNTGYFDYRIGRVFFSTKNSEHLTMQRLGYQKFTKSVRLMGRKGELSENDGKRLFDQ